MWSLILELFENSDRMLLRIQLQSAYIQFHITNVLISFRIKKALSVWKLASTKREDYKKLLHKKARPYRCTVVARTTCIIPLWNGTHMCGRCLGLFFQMYYYESSAPDPAFAPQHPSVQSLTPFCRCERYYICFWPASWYFEIHLLLLFLS